MEDNQTSIYISRNYIPNSEFERTIYGNALQNGMIVVIADAILRANPEYKETEYDRYKTEVNNRWCEVSQVRKTPQHVHFIGLYADGSEIPRGAYSVDYAWIVKRDSIPKD